MHKSYDATFFSHAWRQALTALLLPACLVWAAWAGAQQPAGMVVKQTAELRAMPDSKAQILAILPAQTVVHATGERQGQWHKVRTQQQLLGWLQLFDLGSQASAQEPSNNVVTGMARGMGGLFGGNSNTTAASTPTSTAGIRGAQKDTGSGSSGRKAQANDDKDDVPDDSVAR